MVGTIIVCIALAASIFVWRAMAIYMGKKDYSFFVRHFCGAVVGCFAVVVVVGLYNFSMKPTQPVQVATTAEDMGQVQLAKFTQDTPKPTARMASLSVEQQEGLVTDYCYALYSAAWCKGIFIGLDTEDKVEALVGGEFRERAEPLGEACFEGIRRVHQDQQNGLCRMAWERYGCSGSKEPALLYQSDEVCEYKS